MLIHEDQYKGQYGGNRGCRDCPPGIEFTVGADKPGPAGLGRLKTEENDEKKQMVQMGINIDDFPLKRRFLKHFTMKRVRLTAFSVDTCTVSAK